jgi:hypothetical protein
VAIRLGYSVPATPRWVVRMYRLTNTRINTLK